VREVRLFLRIQNLANKEAGDSLLKIPEDRSTPGEFPKSTGLGQCCSTGMQGGLGKGRCEKKKRYLNRKKRKLMDWGRARTWGTVFGHLIGEHRKVTKKKPEGKQFQWEKKLKKDRSPAKRMVQKLGFAPPKAASGIAKKGKKRRQPKKKNMGGTDNRLSLNLVLKSQTEKT